MAVETTTSQNTNEAAALFVQGDAAAPHRYVHFHGVMGLRVEYDIDARSLELWICPQAGKSLDLELRNFSNRDDHTRIFDRIRLPGLDPEEFRGCAYDPLHCILDFGADRLHLAQHPDAAAVALWLDSGGDADLKSDKQDAVGERTSDLFSIIHPDRGWSLGFAAALGAGDGGFWHAPVLVPRRSVHARARLAPGQLLVLAGELADEPVVTTARRLAALGVDGLLAAAESAAAPFVEPGRLEPGPAWRDRQQLARLLALNRRLCWTSQDASGVQRDGPKFIYSLLWVREGMNAPLAAQAGMDALLPRWLAFSLANPTRTADGVFYGQLYGEHTKWEEDGLFYVVWGAHAHWSTSGDTSFLSGAHLRTLLSALAWLDARCWDEERGLYGRFFACESPFAGTRDDGWDAAAGAPASWPPPSWQGRTLARSYDVYINLLQYAVLRMLAPHAPAEQRAQLLARAARIDAALAPLWQSDGLPPYGWLTFTDGSEALAPALEIDVTDYVWGLTMPPLLPPRLPVQRIVTALAERMAAAHRSGDLPSKFLFAYTWPLLAADPAWRDPTATIADLEAFLPEIDRPGRFLPMPGAVMECIGVPDGHPWHDVRPCAFAASQWLPCHHALGLRRLAAGWAVRGSEAIRTISAMPLGGCTADLVFSGGGPLSGVAVDGHPLLHTLQLPDAVLTPGHHRISVGGAPSPGPLLLASDARLLAVRVEGDQIVYRLSGCGPHRLWFSDGEALVELDGVGEYRRTAHVR